MTIHLLEGTDRTARDLVKYGFNPVAKQPNIVVSM